MNGILGEITLLSSGNMFWKSCGMSCNCRPFAHAWSGIFGFFCLKLFLQCMQINSFMIYMLSYCTSSTTNCGHLCGGYYHFNEMYACTISWHINVINILLLSENCFLYCILLHIINCTITLIIFMAHTFSTISYHMNFYHIQTTLCFNYYRCFRRVYHYLLHSLLLKLYM